MTTVVILQPSYLPWIGYFDQMIKADTFVYYDDVQYDKHGWRNRNRIKGPKDTIWLTVPVRHKRRSGQMIKDTEIPSNQPWSEKHIRSIKQAYAAAPYTNDYIETLSTALKQPTELLCELCYNTLDFLREELGIDTPIYKSSELGIGGEQTSRLLNICKHFGAKTYLTGDSARNYLQTDLFELEGIDVKWHNYQHPTYEQQHGDFISHLSIVDLLMNLGPESRKVLSNK